MINFMISLGLMNLLAAMAPGPDFAIIVKQVLNHGRKAGFWTALGIASALLVHMSYCAFGLSLIIQQTTWAFTGIKIIGGSYLIYLGSTALRSAKNDPQQQQSTAATQIKPMQTFRIGFFTNVLNPKAMLFILSMFTLVSAQHLGWMQQSQIALELCSIVFAWFCLLSWMLTYPKIYRHFIRYQSAISKGMGIIFIAFGLGLFFFNPHG